MPLEHTRKTKCHAQCFQSLTDPYGKEENLPPHIAQSVERIPDKDKTASSNLAVQTTSADSLNTGSVSVRFENKSFGVKTKIGVETA